MLHSRVRALWRLNKTPIAIAAATTLVISCTSSFSVDVFDQNPNIRSNYLKRYMSSSIASLSSSKPLPISICEASTTNPLLNKQHVPLFNQIKPEHIIPALEEDIKKVEVEFKVFEELLMKQDESSYTYTMVVERLEAIKDPLSYSWGVVEHLMGVKDSEKLREAHDKMQSAVLKVHQDIGQSQILYKALKSIKSRDSEWNKLDTAQHRIVDSLIRSMENSGVGFEASVREKFNMLDVEVNELGTKFSTNVLDTTKVFKLVITNPVEIEGLPAMKKKEAANKAVKHGYESATADSGPWLLTLDPPTYLACMKNLKNRDVRETLYRAYVTRASEGEKDNFPIIKRILQIKKEMSEMLGYNCYADRSLAEKMAHSVDKVKELLSMLQEKSMPAAIREIATVEQFAKSSGFNEPLALWDLAYWAEREREKLYDYEEEELRPYFALPIVLAGLFQLANRLFGVIVEAADGEVEVWHPDVRYFKIKDEKTNEYIASFYLDPYSRAEDKRGGAWMNVCLGKSKVLNRKPVAYLVCNGSQPVDDKPSLMTFSEVETLFHEFGHGLQHMLTKVEHGDAAGINNIEWDAVELPSQFMENWCYDRPTLNIFAKHYLTGEPLPDKLFEKVKAAKNYQAGLMMLRQLFFGAVDMHLHSSEYDPYGTKTPFEVQQELAKLYTVIPPLESDRFLCAFGHIFGGGYSAGYYSYKWAEVMSADAFNAFEEAGLDQEEKVKEIGRRFRDTVLSLGGGTSPGEVYKKFRGRDPSPAALLKHSGLIQ